MMPLSLGLGLGLVHGGGANLDPAAQAIIARMSTSPSATQASALNRFAKRLRAAGIFDVLDVLYTPNLMHDSQSSCLDWINQSRSATLNGAAAHHAFKHWWGPGSSGAFIDTGYSPSTGGQKFVNSTGVGCIGFWHGVGNTVNVRHGLLQTGTTAWVSLWPLPENPELYGSVGGSASGLTFGTIASVGRTHGVMAVQRDTSSSVSGWARGVKSSDQSSAFVAIPTGNMPLCGRRSNGVMDQYYQDKVGGFFAGATMTSAQHLELSAAWDEAATTVGALLTKAVFYGDSLSTEGLDAGNGLATWDKNWMHAVSLGGTSIVDSALFRRIEIKGVAGETAAQINTRLQADSGNNSSIYILRMGRNGFTDTAATNAAIAAAHATALARSGKLILINIAAGQPSSGGQTTGLQGSATRWEDGDAPATTPATDIQTVNAAMQALDATRYLDLTAALIAGGSAGEQARLVTPQAYLLTNHGVHQNGAGQAVAATQTLAKLAALGY